MSPVGQLISAISAFVAVLATVILATWVLSNKIAAQSSTFLIEIGELKAQIAGLETKLAVLQKSEENRDEKINKMWSWWMTALENGWISHMRSKDGH